MAGYATDVVVVDGPEDLGSLPMNQKLGRDMPDDTKPRILCRDRLARWSARGFSEMKIINTLCGEAIKRQTSAVELCQKVDIMFVLGGSAQRKYKKTG